MARLSQEQIAKLIKAPKNADNIRLALKQERRLAFHVEALQDLQQLSKSKAYQEWRDWALSLLPSDKHEKFVKLVMLPLSTNQITESIFTELGKVFEAQNSQKRANFVDKVLEADADEFMERTGFASFMATTGWDKIRTGVNGFVFIDLPQMQDTFRPEPKPCYLPLTDVWDVEIKSDDRKLEYILFRIPENGMCAADDEFWRIYRKDKGTSTFLLEAEYRHSTYDDLGNLIDGLGYVPINSLFPNSIGTAQHIDKQGPITNILATLDWYLFKEVSYRYLLLYGDYPIMVSYKEKCEYKNEQGYTCEGGRVAFDVVIANSEVYETRYDECPRCAGRKAIGPGSFWTVDPPRDANDVDLMRDPIKIVEISNDKLEFGETYLENLESKIFQACVGKDAEPNNDQAQNEKQVTSSFESRQTVLEALKLTLEEAEEFIWDSSFTLRYGREAYTGSIINYGNKFYLQTVEEINERYKEAKLAGKPMYELAMIRDLANKTQNRHNPAEMQRVEILEQIEPWPDLSLDQVRGMGLAESDFINYFVKLNFNNYVNRFERENMDIVDFGSKASMQLKINTITQKLQEYAKEQIVGARALNPKPTGNQE